MASVLCVDDNLPFLNSMLERLAVANYAVDGVETPNAAIDAFGRNPFKYDVVITDMEFPSCDDGEQLVAELIELRERRGYDAAPEIICITGARSKMSPGLINRLKERGCHYVLKGTDQYFIETQAAMMRLGQLRGSGPTFLFVHKGSEQYEWDNKGKWGCSVGESVNEVFLLHSGRREKVKMDPTPRRLFDLLAKHTSRRPLSVEEVANSMALDEFYCYWQKNDETVSSESVKNNVRRIRVALDKAFKLIGLPFSSTKVLSTETYEDTTEPSGIDYQPISTASIRVADIGSLLPYSERSECYRLRAKAFIEHIP
jgi:CheY-like chemotaxis protein